MQTSTCYTQHINAEAIKQQSVSVTHPPEYGVIAGDRSPCQTFMESLLLVLLEAEEAATVLVHNLECTTSRSSNAVVLIVRRTLSHRQKP